MALREKKAEAIRLRKDGATYSEIKAILNVSKSSLSLWLQDMPLSEERMREVRDKNPRRIEHFRETMQRKREVRLHKVRTAMADEIGKLSKREIYIAGLFLYWGEGSKGNRYEVSVSNTDPAMMRFFLKT